MSICREVKEEEHDILKTELDLHKYNIVIIYNMGESDLNKP